MNRVIRNMLAVAYISVAATIGIACDDAASTQQQSSEQSTSAGASAEPLPAGLILNQLPPGAQDVVAAQKSAKIGDTITLRGRVGGSESPLAGNSAIVTVIDPSVQTCERMPSDACETPWDACCDPDAVKKSATIQVVGADGRPLKTGLTGVGGIAPLKELIITGKVRTPADTGTLVIDATGIYVKG